MEKFINLFGNISLGTAFLYLCAFYGAGSKLLQGYKFLKRKIRKEYKESLDSEALLKGLCEGVKTLQDNQEKMQTAIEEIYSAQEELKKRQDLFEEEDKKRNLNKLNDRLLAMYRLFADPSNNPKKAWSDMEKDSFMRLFQDYEELGGDGYMHSVVQPAMNELDIIPVTDTEKIIALMASRKNG